MGCGDVRYCFAMAILVIIILLLSFFVKSLSDTFFGDALIKLYETLQEYHMSCEVVHLRVDFFQNGCRCHGNGKNAKKMKNTNDHSRLLANRT